ncbi:MAG: acyloxyacyl hydrolase [Candidatus Omnitrophica bacterium]|nr:acyloxyacyl hydrolase [Candidatus Omnitrophota bacterium]
MNRIIRLAPLKIQAFFFLFLFFPFALFAQQIQLHTADAGQEDAVSTGAPDTAGKNSYLNAKSEWGLLVGYGASHPGWGLTRTRVETIDSVYRYGRFLSEETGKSWYRGRPELLIEVPFSSVQNPQNSQMVGFNLLVSRNFTNSQKIVPYVFAGAGLVYTNLDIYDLGSELNGTYQAGTGLRFFISDRISLDLNCRFHHLSNGNTAKPNIPLNSTKFFLGISFYR